MVQHEKYLKNNLKIFYNRVGFANPFCYINSIIKVMEKIKYTNRYNDVFTFSKTEDGNILFEGELKWMRCGWPNVYDDAYAAYCADTDTDERMTLGEFKKAVHEYDPETFKSTPLNKQYSKLVYSDQSRIDMIDPSGGPYMHSGYNMGMFDESFKGMIIKEFKSVPEGYLIVIEK
jgi:hypothetical protein